MNRASSGCEAIRSQRALVVFVGEQQTGPEGEHMELIEAALHECVESFG